MAPAGERASSSSTPVRKVLRTCPNSRPLNQDSTPLGGLPWASRATGTPESLPQRTSPRVHGGTCPQNDPVGLCFLSLLLLLVPHDRLYPDLHTSEQSWAPFMYFDGARHAEFYTCAEITGCAGRDEPQTNKPTRALSGSVGADLRAYWGLIALG